MLKKDALARAKAKHAEKNTARDEAFAKDQQRANELLRDKEHVIALQANLKAGGQEQTSSFFDEKIPIGVRREKSERVAADAMAAYLRSTQEAETTGAAYIAGSQPWDTANKAYARQGQAFWEVNNALRYESFVETNDPKAAMEGYKQLFTLREQLYANPKAMAVKEKLDHLKKSIEEEHILPEMIKRLPKDEQAVARTWYTVDSGLRLADSHVERLREWHMRKSLLDIAREEAITQCKTCHIPAAVVKSVTDTNLSLEERKKNLNLATSDGTLRQIDKPRTFGERLMSVGLRLARAIGIETKRQFVNPELDQRMRKIDELQHKFDEIADTKGAFIGRRPQYQSKGMNQVSQGGLTYYGEQRASIIGDFTFNNEQEPDPYRIRDTTHITEEAQNVIDSLEKIGGTISEQDVATARKLLKALHEQHAILGRTFAKDTGEFFAAREALEKAEQTINMKKGQMRPAEKAPRTETKPTLKQQPTRTEIEKNKREEAFTRLGRDAAALTNSLEVGFDTATTYDLQEAATNLAALQKQALDLVKKYGLYRTTKAYRSVMAAVESAKDTLTEAQFYLAERERKAAKERPAKEQAVAKIKDDFDALMEETKTPEVKNIEAAFDALMSDLDAKDVSKTRAATTSKTAPGKARAA